MAIKVPIRTVFDSEDNAIGLSEFQSGEAIGVAHGGIGLTSLGSANQVLKVNGAGNALEFVDDSQLTPDTYLQVANANISFVTKAVALAANNAQNNLINDRLQVANAASLYSTQNYVNTTFLSKTASAALTGDITGSANFSSNALSISTSIAASGTPTGTFGSSSKIPIIAVGADGRITGISNVAVAAVSSISYTAANGLITINTSDGGSVFTNITSVPDDPLPTGDYGNLTSDFSTLGDEVDTTNYFDAQLPKGGLNTEDLGGLT